MSMGIDTFYSVAQIVINVAVLIILAMFSIYYGGRRILEMFGFRMRPPETVESRAVEALSKSLETTSKSLETTANVISNTAQNIDSILVNIGAKIDKMSEQIKDFQR